MSPRKGLDTTAVLLKAVEIADRDGFDAVTVAALGKALGVRPPSLYNHVAGLPELHKLMVAAGYERLLERMTQAAAGRSENLAIHAMSNEYRQFAKDHPGLYEAMMRAVDFEDPDLRRRAEAVVALVVQVLVPYGLDKDDALHAVRGLRSILHGFTSLERSGQFGLPLDLDESFRRLVDTFLAGLCSMKNERHDS